MRQNTQHFKTRLSLLTAVTFLLMGMTGPALAGIGLSTSSTVTIDTKPPVVTVDTFPEFTVFQGGEMVTFHWTTGDDHPGSAPEDFQAQVRIEGQAYSPFSYFPDVQDHTWQWIAAEVSSSNVHVEVIARDAFGNTTIGSSNDFSVLASVTDVPSPIRDLQFADPAPNPFNPSTRLRFHLPEAGRVDLTVYDARGHRIRSLLSERRSAGDQMTLWDGKDDRGRAQSGGMYLFVLDYKSPQHSGRITKKAVLVP